MTNAPPTSDADGPVLGDPVLGDPVLADLIWHSAELGSSEHFTAEIVQGRPRFRGTVVTPLAGRPSHLTYEVVVNAGWATRSAAIFVARGVERERIELVVDDAGHWMCNSKALPRLDGCIDVDLGWTPATNTLPIRRLAVEVGDETTIDVAWLRFPELTLERATQTYRRLGALSWEFRSDGFHAVLDVDPRGFVVRYGAGLWRRVGPSST